jgi:DNA replication protein DnaC
LASHVREHVQSGGNLILYGPPGTGKDHLLVALLRVAIMADLSAEWINGQDLFGEFRDRIDTDLSEERAVRKFCRADVLAISDPLPPRGSVSDYGATMLYRVIDRRYRGLRATWTTVNVADAAEAARELTGPIFDRLADNCVAVFCNWPSYRRTRRPAWLHTK